MTNRRTESQDLNLLFCRKELNDVNSEFLEISQNCKMWLLRVKKSGMWDLKSQFRKKYSNCDIQTWKCEEIIFLNFLFWQKQNCKMKTQNSEINFETEGENLWDKKIAITFLVSIHMLLCL